MSFVFVFNSFRLTGLHRNRFGDAFQSLQARHLIDAHRMRIRLKIQVRSVSPRLADNLHLRLKNIGIFLGCVQPVLAAMRLKIRLCELTTDLTGRDARDDTTLLRFIRQFAMSPVIDRAIRVLRRLTRDGHDLSHLLR